MTRKTELEAILSPWAKPRDDVDFDAIPEENWPAWLASAEASVAQYQKWFQIGIARAINEIKSKDADGKPLWPSREALIRHLSQINEPY